MLAAILLAGLIAAPLTSASIFVPSRAGLATAGVWAASRRFVFAVIGTALVCLVAAAGVRLLGVSRPHTVIAVACLAGASAIWLPVTRRWNARAHLCWASSVLLFAAYLAFILQWTFQSGLGPAAVAGGLVLWALELFAGLLACAYLWELCEALGTEHWRRRVTNQNLPSGPGARAPSVSLHVPAHNEPPDMVIATLTSLRQLDYPNYEIVAIDDNTDDENLWRPVDDWCASNAVKFVHLHDWPGYKSGALNYALRELTDPRAELIGVVDSDYQLHPAFLARCAALFDDPNVGFIQAPQDYRDWAQAPYYRRPYYSYRYFFAVSQPARNERDAAIFAGTMGLIRRSALDQVGGWDQWCITEDAELSLRILRAGWTGLHVDQSWGQGVMPLTFEALKSQRYRWCFGGIQILRMHWHSLMPAHRGRRNRLTAGQRWGYLSGGLQWYGDLLGVLFFFFLLGGAANLASGGGHLFRKLTPFLAAAIPVLVVLGLIRAVALLRRGTGAGWRDAVGAFFIWQSTSLAVARASVQGLFAREAAFLRTPKTVDRASWWNAPRANWAETGLALCGVLGIVAALTRVDTLSGPLLAGLLVIPTMGFAAAPVNSRAAQRAALPPELGQRRSSEWLRDRTFARGAVAGGTAMVLVGGVAVVALLLASGHHAVQTPRLVPRDTSTSVPAQTSTSPSSSSSSSSSTAPTDTAPASQTPTSTPPSTSSSPTASTSSTG
jgi:cellulose synthase/poly-beta-1,6-N-acetylglucosamine synthase-like glycosyltransferase